MWSFSSCFWKLPFRWRETTSIPKIATTSSEEQITHQIIDQFGQIALFPVGGSFLSLSHVITFGTKWHAEVDGECGIRPPLDWSATLKRRSRDLHTGTQQPQTSNAQRAGALVLHHLTRTLSRTLNVAGVTGLSHLSAGTQLPVLGALLER